jgi:hypothetical protein
VTLSNTQLGLCVRCGRPWHPPALCWAYQYLDAETIERIAANILNAGFEQFELEDQVLAWEGEGGR